VLREDRDDLRWRLGHAVEHLGDKPVDTITEGDIDDMVDAVLRERDAIREATAQGAPLIPRTAALLTLLLAGLRISELCALDGEDLDFAGRRIYVPLSRRDSAGLLVRVSGIKTEAADRIVPMVPTRYDLLLDHKASFDFGPNDPVFATRNGRRNTVDNVRRRIVDGAVLRADELLAERGQRRIVTCTPHTLRRTYASILAELNLPPRRAMHLIGHTNPTLIMRVYQQVLDMGDAGVETLEKAIGCSLTDAFTLLSGRGVLSPNRHPDAKGAPQPDSWRGLEGAETGW
jgi:integrase